MKKQKPVIALAVVQSSQFSVVKMPQIASNHNDLKKD